MTNYRKLLYPSMLVPMVAVYLMISHISKAATGSIGDSQEITNLLSQAKSEAIELRDDADNMATYARSRLSWASFAGKVNEIKEHVNETGKLLAKLEQARATGSLWQQEAIDHITPVLRELAAATESTIDHLNNNKTLVHTRDFREHCSVNYDLAEKLAKLVGDFVDYGETKAKFAELQTRVEAH